MKEDNFLPLWYRNKIEKREKFKFKIYSSLMSIILIITILKFVNYKREINDLKEVFRIDNRNNEIEKRQEKKEKAGKYTTINTYENLKKCIDNKIPLDYMNISGNKISLESTLMDIMTSRELLEHIEKNKLYKIKNIDIESKENENHTKRESVSIKMNIEVLNHE